MYKKYRKNISFIFHTIDSWQKNYTQQTLKYIIVIECTVPNVENPTACN